MNSNRMLGLTTKSQAKSTEKLSSGYKINRAADDAAGLAISEKMRKQVRGLTQASTNAQDGISAVQTAEGALTEVHDMLQRMNELAVKSANGTNSEDDRSYIQSEINALIDEIDRVSETTKFNEIYLLKGDEDAGTKDVYSYKKVTTPASAGLVAGKTVVDAAGQTLDEDGIAQAKEDGDKIYTTAPTAQTAATTSYTAASLTAGTALYKAGEVTAVDVTTIFDVADDGTVSLKDGVSLASGYTTTAGGASTDLSAANVTTFATGTAAVYTGVTAGDQSGLYAKDGTTELTETEAKAALKKGDTLYSTAYDPGVEAEEGVDYTYTPETTGKAQLYNKDGKAVAAADIAKMVEEGEKLYTDKAGKDEVADLTQYTETEPVAEDLVFSLHVGADSTDNNKIEVTIASMSAAGIGVKGLDVSSEDTATAAIDTISEALKQVSKQRSDLGAIQNRLEHTINNLDNVVENTTSAESLIRDTDMATEMVKYANNNILAQAGQAMLAQANQANQGVLSLLG
ncbi:MAG: hypothetical protein NC246_04815 [Muribaculaceae bacterium]|nr:hypothetical protein [Muribaculaceae bacterium]